jgi:RNA polymerase sigma factor (sigma-70 family)
MQAEGDVIRFPGEAEAPLDFAAFFAEEHRGLFKALYFVTGNRADAAELMQDAFLKLWERWDLVDRIDDPTAYLFRVAMNGSRMRARAARRAGRRLVPVGRDRDRSTRSSSARTSGSSCSTWAPRQRAALLLLDMYGYGSEEAARIMGIRPSTVRALATQGRAVLRRTSGGTHA